MGHMGLTTTGLTRFSLRRFNLPRVLTGSLTRAEPERTEQARTEAAGKSGARRPLVLGGLAGWVVNWAAGMAVRRRGRSTRRAPRLALVERIALAPRQSLALVEAEGRRILVATSAEGGPAFYPLDERARPGLWPAQPAKPYRPGQPKRISW